MGAPATVLLEIVEIPRDLAAGGVFVPGCGLALETDCVLVVRGPAGECTVDARVVFADARGAGLQILAWSAAVRAALHALVVAPAAAAASAEMADAEPADTETVDTETVDAEPAAPDRAAPKNVHERLRHLTLTQQIKIARLGEQPERVVLERLYGKAVWEALLHNPRITGAEVSRIARMGTLPRTMLELICTNGTWLQVPEVRRALLGNPRLSVDQILRVLRLLPKHELKLAAVQTAYPFAVRDAAKRMLKID